MSEVVGNRYVGGSVEGYADCCLRITKQDGCQEYSARDAGLDWDVQREINHSGLVAHRNLWMPTCFSTAASDSLSADCARPLLLPSRLLFTSSFAHHAHGLISSCSSQCAPPPDVDPRPSYIPTGAD